ncbi:MAG TPA: 23S rRNA (guanosine(2251)-2'-O)-methyltransferase RlmB [Candidatus Paceibacterota bacterium]
MKPRERSERKPDKVYIYGKHALMEALAEAPHVLKKVFLAPEIGADVRAKLAAANIPAAELKAQEAAGLAGRDAVHQGVIAVMDPEKLMVPFEAFLSSLDLAKNPGLVILGEVQDPHNVGAIIRSAAAFGFAGVLIPEHNQAQITGTVVKTSAGMAFRVPLVRIGNVNHTLRALKEKGFWTYGLAMDGAKTLADEPFDTPIAFVVGNEGAGVREKTLETCDITLSIPMHGRTESLNAAVSAAIVCYAWSLRHPEALS